MVGKAVKAKRIKKLINLWRYLETHPETSNVNSYLTKGSQIMGKMTEIECMEKMIKLWSYLRKYPNKVKSEAYIDLKMPVDRHYCPCCGFTLDNRRSITDCEKCPLIDTWPLWPFDPDDVSLKATLPPCGRPHSIYVDWGSSDDFATRKYFADKMVAASKKRLGKLLKQEKEK